MATRNRFRQRTENENSPYILTYANPYTHVPYGDVKGYEYPSVRKAERFFDQYDAPKPGIAYNDHACRHTRIEGSTSQVQGWTEGSIEYIPKRFYWAAPAADIEGCIPSIPIEVLDELAYSALQKFTTDIEAEGSLLNFLYELKDFGSLISGFFHSLGRFLEWFSKPGLSWQFAIKPFMDDLVKLFGIFQKVKRKIEFLKKNNGKIVQLNYTRKGVEELIPPWPYLIFGVQDSDYPFPRPRAFCGCRSVKYTFRAHAKVKINCKGLDRFDRQLDAYMKALGIGGLFQWIQAGYKAIPFSWLIDFFFKTNRIFDSLKTSAFADLGYNSLEVISSSHSIKMEAEVWLHGKEYYWQPGDGTKVGTYKVKSFSRGPGLPLSGEGGWLRVHSLSDSLSMLAILIQILLPGIKFGRIR